MSKSQNSIMALSRGMYGKRITQKQFEDMLSLKNTNEIATYLIENTPYRQVLENTGVNDWTAAFLGEAVNRYFFLCFSKICRFEIAVGQQFYKYYIVKTEIDQILECTMLILGGNRDAYLKNFSSFLDKYLSIDLFSLAKANSLEEISESLEKTPYKKVFDSVMINPHASFVEYESAFLSFQRQSQLELIGKCFKAEEKKAVTEAMAREYDVKFIRNLARVISCYGGDEAIRSELKGKSLTIFTDKQRQSLLECRSLEDMDNVLKKSPYKDVARLASEKNIMTFTGNYLCNFYRKQLRFTSSPSVAMLSFFYLCKTEKNNIIKIIQGNKYNVPQEDIRRMVIGFGN